MSILNVNQIQPVGGGNTITVSASDVSASGASITASVVTATGGFVSVANTTPIQISLVGDELTFIAVGIGSTTLTLSS